ncbi:hypothetical protein EIP86_007858 [Pleurotus ostreatoroseus]|nr:hypothetical protein EIP86_007858 [Pleurotus ostreatoroseus]
MSQTRTWVITGVSTGLGLSLALYVASRGDKVVGTVRSLSKFPESLKAAGVFPLVVDLDQPDDEVRKAGEAALAMVESVDVVVNNAGINLPGPVEEHPVSDYRAVFQTNFFGLLAFIQPFITHFRTRRAGHILNISSAATSHPVATWSAYSASKAALEALGDILSLELKLFGVRVLTIQPGVFTSAIWAKADPSLASDAPSSDVPTIAKSTIYTDPETQGYNVARFLLENARKSGQIGDPEKYAHRVYELVTKTGLAQDVVAPSGKTRATKHA